MYIYSPVSAAETGATHPLSSAPKATAQDS